MSTEKKLSHTRRAALAQLRQHGLSREAALVSRSLGQALAAAGLVNRVPARGRGTTTLEITDAGRALLRPEDQCECIACRKARP